MGTGDAIELVVSVMLLVVLSYSMLFVYCFWSRVVFFDSMLGVRSIVVLFESRNKVVFWSSMLVVRSCCVLLTSLVWVRSLRSVVF